MMPVSSRSFAVLVVLLFACRARPVLSWAPSSVRAKTASRVSCSFLLRTKQGRSLSMLYGILDDFSSSSSDSSSSTSDAAAAAADTVYEDLFHRLVFSTGDPRTDISEQWDQCSDDGFQQWLISQKESADDQEEIQALQDLLDMIQEVATVKAENNRQEAEQAQLQAPLEPQVEEAETTSTTKMSAADVLKTANSIDQAILSTAAAEEPSDFMTDAKAERGLAGFNSKGRMRVGGS